MQLVLDRKYDDLDILIEDVRDWNLDFRQLETGGFYGRIIQSISPHVFISYARFGCKLHQEGLTPSGYRTFVIPCAENVNFWWLGHSVTSSDLLVFSESRNLESASNNSFEIFTVSLEESYLEDLLQAMQLPRFQTNAHVIRLDPETAVTLRGSAMRALRTHSSADSHALAEMIISSRGLEKQSGKAGRQRLRDQAIRLVCDYLHDRPNADLNISDMCRLANVSERTLQYTFKQRYGVSPNNFIKRWKLNSAKKLLLKASPYEVTISQIAESLNFNHQSQFAADYRILFGELPSQTLARAQ